MGRTWEQLPYDEWSESCDTLHAYTQLLGKLSLALAAPEPQLQHTALRLTSRGFETALLPAADGSGGVVAALDLHRHELVVEHSDGRAKSVPLTPDREVGEVVREALAAIDQLAGSVRLRLKPQEVSWTVPLDEDDLHHTYNAEQVERYLAVATRAALVLAALRAPYRGRSSPVNAWWGSFDLAVSFFSGLPADPPSQDFIWRNSADAQQIEVGWWPGSERYPRAAFFAFAAPSPPEYGKAALCPPAARFDATLGEFVFDWDDVVTSADPFEDALSFGRSALAHSCSVCEWDGFLAESAVGSIPPVH